MGDSRAAEARIARAGPKQGGTRRRAVGTRDRVIAHLAAVTEVADRTGMASTRLAEAVGYPGTSVAFAQLLSGMERDGLIVREVRGKRTYRITLSPATAESATAGAGAAERAAARAPAGTAETAAGRRGGSRGRHAAGAAGETLAARAGTAGYSLLGDAVSRPGGPAAGPAEFDYDELARRLLIQVVRRLAAGPGERLDAPTAPDQAVPEQTVPEQTVLEQTVAGLERELASAWTKHGTLTAENVKLREQLREAQRSLELARERTPKLPITDELNRAEVVLLERLLSPGRENDERRPGANAS
ncbi:MAG: hypothetical protein JOY82_04360 [Streptosporangiaceae bacterium]|nr:hypothetical protein [Streptosporangiaceae bacterium]MBV9853745.1 hypothetical protein [Streptosporangiaceae bacterium]